MAKVLVFLVEPSDRGAVVEPQELTGSASRTEGADGTDGADAGRLVLDGVFLEGSRVLGGPDGGADVAGWLVSRCTVGLCVTQAGVVARADRAATPPRRHPGDQFTGVRAP